MQMTQAIKLSTPWAKEQKFVNNVSSYEAACTEREKVAGAVVAATMGEGPN